MCCTGKSYSAIRGGGYSAGHTGEELRQPFGV